jgi:CO/xanthine dehydrogenase FAD-binding subunit
MKPPPFEYEAPRTADEAVALLAQHGDRAKVLAGGQSLVPLLNFRLAQPEVLVDVNRVAELAYVRPVDTGLAIGALTRQHALERSSAIRGQLPIVAEACHLIGHLPIRHRGTVGGSLAHADPASELPAVMVALEAELTLSRKGSRRTVPADQFFIGIFSTALEPEELLTDIRVPGLPPRTGGAFVEIARRAGDFALVGVAALVAQRRRSCLRARLALCGPVPRPSRARGGASADRRVAGGRVLATPSRRWRR